MVSSEEDADWLPPPNASMAALSPAARLRRKIVVSLGFGVAATVGLRSMRPPRSLQAAGTPATTRPLLSTPRANERAFPTAPALPEVGPEPDRTSHVFDLVIRNGRAIDPISGFDAVADLGIDGTVITSIGPPGLRGRSTLDATNLVVSPGFVDLLSYEPNLFGAWFKVADGVTTNLEMHGVNNYAAPFFDRYEADSPIHFGGAFHQHFHRGNDLGVAPDRELSPSQIEAFAELAARELDNGYGGIAFSPEYSPASTRAEIDRIAVEASQRGHVAFFHTRSSDPASSIAGIQEAIDLGRRTGIGIHVSHLHSTGGTRRMDEAVEVISAARAEGLDVTACVYPYDFWATTLASFRFAGDWRTRYGLSYGDLQVAGTNRRLTAETFDRAQRDNLLVAALGSIPEADLRLALEQPWVMIGSDAILTESLNNHPRATGTYSRLLGRYVRDTGLLDLAGALAKITSLPAQRVEGTLPAMRRKGRLQRGADADITVFDPATIRDQSTIERPDQAAIGIHHVLVEGTLVLTDGQLQGGSAPGRALRSTDP